MRVRAIEEVFYGGRDRIIGEEFETEDDLHAKVLEIAGKIMIVTEEAKPEKRGRYKRRDLRAEK